MANINGLTLKAIRTGVGHDRAGWDGNLYLNNKRIGSVVEDGWGGGLQVNYTPEHKPLIDETVQSYFSKFPEQEDFLHTEDIFFDHLMELCLTEKDYKKGVKNGRPVFIVLNPRSFDKPRQSYECMNVESMNQLIEQEKPDNYYAYTSLDDFVVTV